MKMSEKGIMTDFRRQWNDTCKAAGIKPITIDTAARIMAVVFCFDHELITHNPKLKADIHYIQEEYHLNACELPDAEFTRLFKHYAHEIEYNGFEPTEWAKKLMLNNYNIKL